VRLQNMQQCTAVSKIGGTTVLTHTENSIQ